MANDSSLGGAKQLAFDLDSQKGVAHLLASVRASVLPSEQKNELRDLIFLYSHGGKDPSVRITLEQKLSAFAVEALPVAPVFADAKSYSFGTSRPSPSFIPTSTTNKSPAAKPQPAAVPIPPPAPTEAEKPKEDKPLPTVPSAPVPPPVNDNPPPATPAAPASYDPQKNLQRIREIKSLVNERVGNPVNLVDIDNQVGREYMGALLEAMKKVNSGSSAIDVMARLEKAYEMVDKTLLSQPQPTPVSVPPANKVELKVPEPEPQSEPEANPLPATPKPTPVVDNPEPAPMPPPKPPVQADVPVAPPIPKAAPAVNLPVKQAPPAKPVSNVPAPSNLPTAKPSEVLSPKPVPPPPQPKPKPVAEPTLAEQLTTEKHPPPVIISGEAMPIVDRDSQTEIKPAWGEQTDTVHRVENTVSELEKAHSLAESEVKPRRLEDLPTAASLETSTVTGDPLFTKEVDSGLEQLLSEWSLFKKSGLFGTGPKGREHPLYKKISSLQIPLLLAGRFEGATQEIKQSITDYMNGWRYEQGIIYQQGENFDHYLRRVIRHILDLQNQ